MTQEYIVPADVPRAYWIAHTGTDVVSWGTAVPGEVITTGQDELLVSLDLDEWRGILRTLGIEDTQEAP